jgi:hypothetical protein
MKALLSLVILCFILSVRSAAIPQNVGGTTGFFGAAGVPFEQFAVARDTWEKDAELKGSWQARGTGAASAKDVETLDLAMDADVFGIPAAQVSAERAGGTVRRFIVRFDEKKSKAAGGARGGDLFARVSANLRAMAGEPKGKSAGGDLTFRNEAALIVARRVSAMEVLVEFTPAR